jgi:hypothetical protein
MVHDRKVQYAEATGQRGTSDFVGAMQPTLCRRRKMARYRDRVLFAQDVG